MHATLDISRKVTLRMPLFNRNNIGWTLATSHNYKLVDNSDKK